MSGDVINFKDFQVPPSGAILDYLFFNLRFLNMCSAINGLAARQDSFDATSATLVQTSLDRINAVLGPLLTELQEAAQSGFLIANAEGLPVTLVLGTDIQFTINSHGSSLFTPTPWLMAADENDVTNWGLLSFTSYDSATGVLAGHCIYATKSQSSARWTLSCSAGVVPAMMDMLAQAQTASSAAVAAQSGVTSQIGTLTSLIAAAASGPVIEVCGYTGIVNLATADIAGLVATLNTLATTAALNSGLSTKQTASSLLTAFAALSLSANVLPYATGPNALALTAFTALARTLLACADGPSMCTAIGASTPASVAAQIASATISSSNLSAQFDDQTGTSYTFVAADNGEVVTLTNAASIAASLPNNLAKGWNVLVYQGAAGIVTFSAASGATLRNRQNQFKSAGIYAVVSLLCVSNTTGTNAVYVLGGDTQT